MRSARKCINYTPEQLQSEALQNMLNIEQCRRDYSTEQLLIETVQKKLRGLQNIPLSHALDGQSFFDVSKFQKSDQLKLNGTQRSSVTGEKRRFYLYKNVTIDFKKLIARLTCKYNNNILAFCLPEEII